MFKFLNFSRHFGHRPSVEPKRKTLPATEYEGFRITPQPMKEAQGFRLSALIEKDVDGQSQSHTLIRADTISDFDACVEASIAKAKQMIDQQGAGLF